MARKCSEVQPEERARFVRVARPFLVAVYVAGVYDECMRSEAGLRLVAYVAPGGGVRSAAAWAVNECCDAHRGVSLLGAEWEAAGDAIGPLVDCDPPAFFADGTSLPAGPRSPSWLSGLGLSAFDLDAARRRDLPFAEFCAVIGATRDDVYQGSGGDESWVQQVPR